jgi:hypothetical protein
MARAAAVNPHEPDEGLTRRSRADEVSIDFSPE